MMNWVRGNANGAGYVNPDSQKLGIHPAMGGEMMSYTKKKEEVMHMTGGRRKPK